MTWRDHLRRIRRDWESLWEELIESLSLELREEPENVRVAMTFFFWLAISTVAGIFLFVVFLALGNSHQPLFLLPAMLSAAVLIAFESMSRKE